MFIEYDNIINGENMRFKKIYVEILNTCNLKCSFCIQNSRKPEMISIDKFDYVLNQIKPYTDYIYLHILGEPLMHPELDKFLSTASKYEMKVNITTNGTLLADKLDVLMKHNCVRQINVSIHSFPDKVNYLNKVLDSADKLSKNGVYMSLRLWTFDEHNISNSMSSTIDQIQNRYNIMILEYKNSHRLDERLFLSFDETFDWPTLELPYVSNRGKCQGWIHQCGILVDGSIVPCCLDSKGVETLGNIYETPFETILSNNQNLLENMRNHNLPLTLCHHCTYRTRFDKEK